MSKQKFTWASFIFFVGMWVMVAEIMSAHLLYPYFGSSMVVWASVLCCTLLSLALGYYIGDGWIRRQLTLKTRIYYAFLFGLSYVLLLPYLSPLIFEPLLDLNPQLGILIASTLALFPSLLAFGTLAPLFIEWISKEHHHAGSAASFYLIFSTLGGVFGCLYFGVWAMAALGLSYALLSMLAFNTLAMVIGGMFRLMLSLLLTLGFTTLLLFTHSRPAYLIESFESSYGKVELFKFPLQGEDKIQLRVNGIVQSGYCISSNPRALPEYNYLKGLEHFIKTGIKGPVLLLGMGGGTLANSLSDASYMVDAVEWDPAIIAMAYKYFHLRKDIRCFQDDARHFIKTSDKKYQYIVMDLYRGESPPEHCYTLEAFQEIKKQLLPGGSLLLNITGYRTGEKAAASACIAKTLKASGFEVEIYGTNFDETQNNLILLAKPASTGNNLLSVNPYVFRQHLELGHFIHRDKHPVLQKLALAAGWEMRKGYRMRKLRRTSDRGVKI